MRRFILSAFLLVFCTLAASAQQAVEITVVRTSPSSGFLLPRFGTIYLDIAYQAEQPLRLQARAYVDGASLDKGQAMNASVIQPTGSGRALVWISYSEPAKIDEIRVTAYDEGWNPLQVLRVALPARWLAKPVDKYQAPPAWVSSLIAADEKNAAQYRLDHPPEPDPIGDIVVTFVFLAVPGYFLLQAVALFTQRGRWRVASLAPLLIMLPATLHAAYALSAGSNIWPIVLIFAAPIGFLYLIGLFIARKLSGNLSAA